MRSLSATRTDTPRAARIIGRVALALAIAFAAYFLVYRPLQLRWGATGEEVARAMPGDEVQQYPIFNATRAVTIDARPEDVWPWLVQIGYKRAGWYGLDLLDNAGIPSARRIVPELQSLKVGDLLPIWEIAYQHVAEIVPNRNLLTRATTTPPGSGPSIRSTRATPAWSGGCTRPPTAGLPGTWLPSF